MLEDDKKTCFVIAPIGNPGSTTRERSDRVMRHIIRPAVSRFDYTAVRADEIAEPGIISTQVIDRIVNSALVIADLTEYNPNVFYELAIRHVCQKPFVQIIENGNSIPFDVAVARTVFFGLDLDGAADAADQVAQHVAAIERDPTAVDTPISFAVDLQRLGRTAGAEEGTIAQLMPLLTSINSTVTNVRNQIVHARDVPSPSPRISRRIADARVHQAAVDSDNPYGFLVSVSCLRERTPWLYELGVAAYQQVLAGNFQVGRGILEEMNKFLQAVDPPPDELIQSLRDDWDSLFGRLVDHLDFGPGSTVILPF